VEIAADFTGVLHFSSGRAEIGRTALRASKAAGEIPSQRADPLSALEGAEILESAATKDLRLRPRCGGRGIWSFQM